MSLKDSHIAGFGDVAFLFGSGMEAKKRSKLEEFEKLFVNADENKTAALTGLIEEAFDCKAEILELKRDIQDLMDIGRLITESAFSLVLENDTVDELVELLEKRLTEQRMIVVRNNDYFDFVKAGDAFNRAFIEASHNIRMNTVYDRMSNLLFLCMMQYYSAGHMDIIRNLDEHEAMIDAVRKKDPALLREALMAHYDIHKLEETA